MLLEEAIRHCEEKALCGDACGLEHKQLADWLRELIQLRYQNERWLKIVRRHKYKRCLDKAERCNDKIDNPVQCDEHDDWLIITEYWERWHKRWLELAEKFKEGV